MSELYLSSFHVPRSGYCLMCLCVCELILFDMVWLIDFVCKQKDSLCVSEF